MTDDQVKMYMLLAGYGAPMDCATPIEWRSRTTPMVDPSIMYWNFRALSKFGIHSIVVMKKTIQVHFTYDYNLRCPPVIIKRREDLPSIIEEYL